MIQEYFSAKLISNHSPPQLPTQSNPFYWQYAEEHEHYLDADSMAMMGHFGRGWDRGVSGSGGGACGVEDVRKSENYVKTKGDAMTLLELECNQTFLGMVQMQYQAVVDIVQLIGLLEKACIREDIHAVVIPFFIVDHHRYLDN